jgi:hypothetical protein
MKVSNLTKKELRVHDNLLIAIGDLSELTVKQRKNVYERLEMLNIFNPELTSIFESNIKRIK